MSSFKHDMILQELIIIICNEGRVSELIDACDYYHYEFPNHLIAFEWGYQLGEYMGKFCPGQNAFRFEIPESKTIMYFIGDKDSVKDRIHKVL